ncbi:MAG: MogA/MoaB family molybdenum cofactor biosynthesis protein [Thermoplasmatota archaeon]
MTHAASTEKLSFAILTVSDSRKPTDDRSGDVAAARLAHAGHAVSRRGLVRDDADAIAAWVRSATADPAIQGIIVTGGTGAARRDVTPEAVVPLFEKPLPGVGELFRRLSFDAIGPFAALSRAEAGVIQGKPVFLFPGSPDSVALGIDGLVVPLAGHIRELAR